MEELIGREKLILNFIHLKFSSLQMFNRDAVQVEVQLSKQENFLSKEEVPVCSFFVDFSYQSLDPRSIINPSILGSSSLWAMYSVL